MASCGRSGARLSRNRLDSAGASGRSPPSTIGRSERPWAFAEAFSKEAGIQTLSVAQLVAESMPVSWFGPRTLRGESLAAPANAGESRMMKALQLDREP